MRSWEAIARAAERHDLLPALWPAVTGLGGQNAVPATVARRSEEHHRRNRVRNLLLRRQLVHVTRTLNGVGIEPLVLKGGTSIVQPLFPDPGARYMADLDLMLRPDQLAPAGRALTSLGYEERPWRFNDFSGPAHDSPFFMDGQPGPVELHGELGPSSVAGVLPAAAVWEQAVPSEADGTRLWLPSPTHLVLHNVLHAQVHSRGHAVGALPLRDLYTLAWIVHRHGHEVDWDEVVERLRRQGLERVLCSHLFMAQCLLGVPMPGHLKRSVGAVVHLIRVGMYAALEFPEDLERRIRLAFESEYMGHLYGPFDRRAALNGARARHAARLIWGCVRRERRAHGAGARW
ncbi:MAG: nucleotidyltransferase family protein [Actinomycetota bacterium]|nr:nucleotidyltransferase family protein [Actinomycetota bacterium]